MLPASLANNQSALLDKTFCSWALAWSNQVPITSPVNTFLLCVTFTMFCTSFLTTKTQPPLLCKQRILTRQWVCLVIFKFWTWTCPIYCTNELSSPPLRGISFSICLALRYDESSSHPYLRAGRTHRASQGQRQPQALPGVWGEWAKGSKVKVPSEYWFLSNCVFIGRARKSPFFPPGK